MKLIAINVGKPKLVPWQGKEVLTSIFKSPVEGPVTIRETNVEGDEQSDLTVHGGADKAVYAYSFAAYSYWKKELGLETLPFGALGENLTIDEMDEAKIFVGDIFQLNECTLQAVQPRVPCFKLGIRFGDLKVIKFFNELHRSGVYFRVLKPGRVQAGDTFEFVSSEAVKASISELFQFIKDKGITTPERAAELAKIKSLNGKWRSRFRELAEDAN